MPVLMENLGDVHARVATLDNTPAPGGLGADAATAPRRSRPIKELWVLSVEVDATVVRSEEGHRAPPDTLGGFHPGASTARPRAWAASAIRRS
jgi:hypothetical protein